MSDELNQLKAEIQRLSGENALYRRNLQQISQAASIGHWEVDLVENHIYWSRKTHELHGTDPATYKPVLAEAIGFFTPDSQGIITAHFQRLRLDATPYDLELQIVRRDSTEPSWVRATGIASIVDGKVVKAFGTFQDIQAQKQVQLERDALNQKLHHIMDTFNIGFWDWTVATDELNWNEPMFRLFGVAPGDFDRRFSGWAKTVHPADLERTSKEFQDCIANSDFFNSSFRIFHSKLGVRHIRGSALITRDADGTPLRVWGINYDVTQEKRDEERLLMLESLVNASPDIFGIASPKGDVLFLNNTARNYGWSEEKSFGDIFPVESIAQYVNDIFPVLKTKGHWHGEVTFKDPHTGEEFAVHQHSFLLRDSAGHTIAVATIASDIRERKKIEATLEAQRLQLVQASKMTSLGEMASGMAHEINNPLAIIKGNVALLDLQLGDASPDFGQLRKSLGTIDQTVDRIAGIIKALRIFAKDGAEDPRTVVSLTSIVETTLNFFRSRITSASVVLNVKVEDPNLSILARQSQLSQALTNLVSNAFEAARNSPVPEVLIEVYRSESAAFIKVSDSGPGIPTELRDKILEPFFTTREVGKGTGLGLPMAKGLVEVNDGRLYLDTSAPRTTFVIEFPVRP